VRRNNWPPLPDKFCVQPCFYHDINIDIPSEFQKIVQNLYHLWIFYTGVLAVNVIGGMLLMFVHGNVAMFFLAIFYCLLFTPASFLCW
jgi:secretory carrier-associated membrane protein